MKNIKKTIQIIALAGLVGLLGCGGGGNSVTPLTAAVKITDDSQKDQPPQTATTTTHSGPPVTEDWPPQEVVVGKEKVSKLPAVVDYEGATSEVCEMKNPLAYLPLNNTKITVDSVNSLIQGVGGIFKNNIDPNLNIVLVSDTEYTRGGTYISNYILPGGKFTAPDSVLVHNKTVMTYRYDETLAHELGHSVDISHGGNSEFIPTLISVASAFVIETEHPWFFQCPIWDALGYNSRESCDSLISDSLGTLSAGIVPSIYKAAHISTAMILKDHNGDYREAINAVANISVKEEYSKKGFDLEKKYSSVIRDGAVIDGIIDNVAEIKCDAVKKILKNNINDTTLKEVKAKRIYELVGVLYEVEKNVYKRTSCDSIIPYSGSFAERTPGSKYLEDKLNEGVINQENYPQ